MSYKIRSDVNAVSQIKVQNKNTGLSITDNQGNTYNSNSSGEITFPVLTTDEVNYITQELPLSQYGELYDTTSLNITATSFTLNFNRIVPMFMSGRLHKIPVSSVTVNSVSTNTTMYVYAMLDLGVPKYDVQSTEQPETETTMFIGTILVTSTGITTINVNRVSRFGIYRPSVTKIGSGFPVSTGVPNGTASITW